MSKDRVPRFLAQAEEKEKTYDWLGAVEFHKKAFEHVLKQGEFLKAGDVQERIGCCFYRAAFQADSQQEFKQKLGQAVEAYRKAAELYGKINETEKTPKMMRCEAMTTYIGYWLTSEAPEKKRLINECWRLVKKSLEAFEEAGDGREYGRTYNQLCSSAFLTYVLEWDFQTGEKIVKEAMEHGERAVTLLSNVGDPYELARAHVKAAFYLITFCYYFIPDMDERERNRQKGRGYLQKAIELSEEAALLEIARTPGSSGDELGWSTDEMLAHFKKALDCAEKTKDKYMIGTTMDWLAYATLWKPYGIEDPDKRAESLKKALQYAEDAKHQFSSISFVSPRRDALWTGAPHAHYHGALAIYETDLSKRHVLLEKAVTDGAHAIQQAENSGYPGIICHAHFILGSALGWLAQIETSLEEKKKLLEKSREHMEEVIRIGEQRYPFNYWNSGLVWVRLAGLKAELSNVEKDAEDKKRILEEAISNSEHGLQLLIKENIDMQKRGELLSFAILGLFQYIHGELLNRLHGLTNNNEHQRKAMKAFDEASESYQKLNLVSRLAECCWKIARSYDALGQHLKAAERFKLASNNYKSAGEKIPQLKSFYQDHARYMQAWSEIEKARDYHAKSEYGRARDHYKKATNLHRSTERWNHLTSNYLAWARLEEAEDLSRREQTEKAKELFQQAANLFVETRKTIKAKLEKVESEDEKEMLINLAKASDVRHEYCLGRIALEEAKILDRQGDHAGSSRKYGSATKRFQNASDGIAHEANRQELKPIIHLCQAWRMMTQAEAEATPDLYLEASKLFDEAKEHSRDEKAKLLALGHSHFCKALEAGTRFEAARDQTLYSAATQHLESAASYYAKAGFKTASEYAEATQRLLDAYLYVHNAKTETDPAKKARFYLMAEKVLQASAGSYLKAKHPEKHEQVSSLLEKVRKEKELALSLHEVLHAPLVTSTTATFTTPTPTEETAVGLERFEHADIQANLILRAREVKVGEDIHLALELVNAGKAPALLIKMDEVVPEGFEIKEVPESYIVEDRYLNMKGKRLNPLKTEDVKMVVKPRSKGTFMMKPRILYIDETGKYKSHEPEPVTITVKELGIKDWIKGER